ncbi:long-chain fatty acid--CoA ligase [Quadrisphaera sp. DSM 44207]|uniref:AMP-dependent synthetase/ligase n=1 Tax=Quadrisphaera sp. DSM 44207 TaxID=1881057 RepID=UPI00088CC7B6|nr:AMP-dependent synthetase/ligase [Quadrisphaera sp. DSM 44207]SDQ33339.1 long-chain acyl-CoA synthetase [Quadrisphaera sp. DSM 44207]
MSEHAVPLAVRVDPATTIPDLVLDAARRDPQQPLYRRWRDGAWVDVSAAAFLEEVTALAKGLVAAGVQRGDRVGLLARTRYEWTLADVAIWFAGAVSVPVYETSSAEQARWILSDSGAVGCVVEGARHAQLVAGVRGDLPQLRSVWSIEDGDLERLAAEGAAAGDEELQARRRGARGDDLATIIYTSGTTGRPKGCQLTHANFVVLSKNAIHAVPEVFSAEGASTLLFLPLAHVFGQFIQVLCLASPVTLGHAADIKNLTTDLATFRPTFLLAVPRVFEKVYNGAEQKAIASGRGRVFARAAQVAERYSRALDDGGPGLGLRAQHALFDRLVYSRLRAALGGRAQYAVSGSAPLGERLGHFFRGAGIVVLQGYGLTETTAPTCVTLPGSLRIGTVGPPLPGCSVRVADDGEVLVAGPHVFTGYWNDPAATAAAMEGPWFRTGDLGVLDDEGNLTITGRKKEIIVTAGGKNVAPAVLEDQLRAHPLISQTIVVGDQRPFVAALVTLDADMLPAWLRNHGKPEMTVAQAAQDPDVLAEVQRAVDTANTAVSRAESIRKFVVLDTDFTEEGGHLTPSMKLKRSVIARDYAPRVEEIYAG